eukprot:Seg190.21 transcript_id=Seg190.21/GoldUCD/mRNA.D3Y31 product="hypothetical protein" protein_id=Seg190.21/GoldUCD/D3Y31
MFRMTGAKWSLPNDPYDEDTLSVGSRTSPRGSKDGNVSPDVVSLRSLDLEDAMQDGKKSVRFYLDQLERHLNPQLYLKNPSKKMLKGIVNVELLLTSLDVDLRSRPNPM